MGRNSTLCQYQVEGLSVYAGGVVSLMRLQVIEKSLEAQVLKSDNSSLARDCRRDMQQLNRCATHAVSCLLVLLPGCNTP
jgi:hypothetical protein